ncbi:pentapeptide repeat-containing protein, partial [Adlercreutzia equolifaciens]|uniref:pentapeptide repeat-containing protein n=1 Tax=Adlercreutzia equolifaciens TaxID=446660 RepID=UPI00242D341B
MPAIPDPAQTAYEAAAAQRTLSLPTIPEELRALEADDLRGGAEEPLEAIDASGLIIADENFSELQAAHARFANCFLSCCDFSGSLFTDTVFEGCDFANSYFDNAGFTRCTFKNCKLTGASLMEANLEHVTLTDCTLDFGAFNRCRFWAVSATRCDFSGADMAEMELH